MASGIHGKAVQKEKDAKQPESVDVGDNNQTVMEIYMERLLKIYAMNRKRLRMKI